MINPVTVLNLAGFISGGASTLKKIYLESLEGKLQGLVNLSCVIVNKKNCTGIQNLIAAGFPEKHIHIVRFKADCKEDQQIFGERIAEILVKYQVNVLGQYGWLAKTPINVINGILKNHNQPLLAALNQHPGPLDCGKHGTKPRLDFGGAGMYGARVHAAVLYFCAAKSKIESDSKYYNSIDQTKLAYSCFTTEASCHLVTENYDEGAVIGRKSLEISEEELELCRSSQEKGFRQAIQSLQTRLLSLEHDLQVEILGDLAERSSLKPLIRSEAIVRADEIDKLNEAKDFAIKLVN